MTSRSGNPRSRSLAVNTPSYVPPGGSNALECSLRMHGTRATPSRIAWILGGIHWRHFQSASSFLRRRVSTRQRTSSLGDDVVNRHIHGDVRQDTIVVIGLGVLPGVGAAAQL